MLEFMSVRCLGNYKTDVGARLSLAGLVEREGLSGEEEGCGCGKSDNGGMFTFCNPRGCSVERETILAEVPQFFRPNILVIMTQAC